MASALPVVLSFLIPWILSPAPYYLPYLSALPIWYISNYVCILFFGLGVISNGV